MTADSFVSIFNQVHKRIATIRYMFFNRDDIEYFAPIELHTKFGRTGHVKEALGTHGYFKAVSRCFIEHVFGWRLTLVVLRI